MAVKTMPVPLDAGRAVCSDPEHLPLVDAAANKPGGPEAQVMKATLCRHCPVNQTCFEWAMTHPEYGVWGGTSPKYRTTHAAPSARKMPRTRTNAPSKADLLCRQFGVRGTDVRKWAYEQGIVTSRKGRVPLDLVEAWAVAHQAA